MQAVRARARQCRRRRTARVLLLGLVLGLLQVLLLLGLSALQAPIKPASLGWWWLLVGALPYLLLPALAGFLAARQPTGAESPVGEGCLVGSIGVLLPTIAGVVIAVIQLTIAPPEDTCSSPLGICHTAFPGLIWAAVLLLVFLLGVGGVVGGLLGGWLGGLLGKRSRPAAGNLHAKN